MKKPRRFATVLLAVLAMAPVVAAGRAACCMPTPVSKAHACCVPSGSARTMAPKGCCKTTPAPKPETRLRDAGPIVLSSPPVTAGGSSAGLAESLPATSAVRLARQAHHDVAPNGSPPDLLSLSCILLI